MQFFKIAAYVQIARLYGLVYYAACAFCPYMHGLRSALVGVADQFAYTVLGRVGIERARV